jgi:hypothetical protein
MGAKPVINLSNLNITEVIDNKRERLKATYVIDKDGNCYYLYCGNQLREKDFERMFPVDIINNNPKGLNADTTHVK